MHALTGLSGLSALLPAPAGGGALFSDSFNRADNASSLGAADTGQVWQAIAGTWGILSNQAYCSADGGAFFSVALLSDAGGADGVLQVTLAQPGGASGGSSWIIFRSTADANQFIYVVGSDSASYTVATYDAANVTTIATGTIPAAQAGDVVRIEFSGSAIQVYINDVLDIDTTSAFAQTEVGKGIGTDFGVSGGPRFDNLSFTT